MGIPTSVCGSPYHATKANADNVHFGAVLVCYWCTCGLTAQQPLWTRPLSLSAWSCSDPVRAGVGKRQRRKRALHAGVGAGRLVHTHISTVGPVGDARPSRHGSVKNWEKGSGERGNRNDGCGFPPRKRNRPILRFQASSRSCCRIPIGADRASSRPETDSCEETPGRVR